MFFEQLEGRTLLAATGLAGAYFARTNLTAAKIARVDGSINFQWSSGTPASALGTDGFSSRWAGTVSPKYSGVHTFIATTSGGVRVWVNNELIVDAWDIHTQRTDSGDIRLGAGKKYEIRIDYRSDGKNTPAIKLEWQSSRLPRQVVPQSRLAPYAIDRVKPTTPGNLQADINGTSVTLDWDASSDASGVVAYDIYSGSSKIASTLASESEYSNPSLTAGKSYNFSVQAIDASGNVSAMTSVPVQVPLPPPPPPPPNNPPAVRIMPLGDSITADDGTVPTYRYYLWHDLLDGGHGNVDFVGSKTGVGNGSPMFPDFDQDHEGHTGLHADEIEDNAAAWATAANPDIVLLHIGTNDIMDGQSNTSTIIEINNIIDALRSVNPKIKILLAKIISMTGYESKINDLNSRMVILAGLKNTSNSPVVLVDINTGFSNSDLRDGVHLNSTGEAKMADRWYNALVPLL